MAIVDLLVQRKYSFIGAVTLDAEVKTVHTSKSVPTEHPVEVGADITDHVRALPTELQLEGIVSGSPLDASLLDVSATSQAEEWISRGLDLPLDRAAGGDRPARSAASLLRRIVEKGILVRIRTNACVYDNMLLYSLVQTDDASVGNDFAFSCMAKEIRLAQSQIVRAPVTQLKAAQAPKSKGKQPTKPPAAPEKASFLYNVFKSADLLPAGAVGSSRVVP